MSSAQLTSQLSSNTTSSDPPNEVRIKTVGILNNGLSNVGSVSKAIAFNRHQPVLISTPAEIDAVDVIVLAGVGHFKSAVDKLDATGFREKLTEAVVEQKKPVIGLCLGMQLFFETGYEDGVHQGLGWLKGDVVKIDPAALGEDLRVPHIGWNAALPVPNKDPELFEGLRYGSFYFMHGYHVLPKDSSVIAATTKYGNLEIVSAVRKDNIMGVQFHPEKSQGDGLRLFRNMLELDLWEATK